MNWRLTVSWLPVLVGIAGSFILFSAAVKLFFNPDLSPVETLKKILRQFSLPRGFNRTAFASLCFGAFATVLLLLLLPLSVIKEPGIHSLLPVFSLVSSLLVGLAYFLSGGVLPWK